jgi:hypothetical protein
MQHATENFTAWCSRSGRWQYTHTDIHVHILTVAKSYIYERPRSSSLAIHTYWQWHTYTGRQNRSLLDDRCLGWMATSQHHISAWITHVNATLACGQANSFCIYTKQCNAYQCIPLPQPVVVLSLSINILIVSTGWMHAKGALSIKFQE